MIKTFITDVCRILKIKSPKISYDTSHFATETMMAQYNPFKNTIYLKRYEEPNPDQFFSIAHELRHAWQFKTNEASYFGDYKTVDLCNSVVEYNLQLAEIDANAFASFILMKFFGMRPLFNGVPEVIKARIFEHLDSIQDELEENLFN